MQLCHLIPCGAITLVLLFAPLTTLTCAPQKIPSYIENLVFKTSDFSIPVTLQIPLEDKSGMADEIRRTEQAADREGGLVPRLIIWLLSMDKTPISQSVLDFLTHHDYVRVETITVNIGRERRLKEFKLLYYNDKIKPYIIRQYSDASEILLGSRELKSVDYTNQYEGTLLETGAKTQFYALTFSYVLKNKLPELPQVNQVFHGKAKAYLDPDDGKWKFWHDGLELGDRNYGEYTTLMQEQQVTPTATVAKPEPDLGPGQAPPREHRPLRRLLALPT